MIKQNKMLYWYTSLENQAEYNGNDNSQLVLGSEFSNDPNPLILDNSVILYCAHQQNDFTIGQISIANVI